MFTGIVTDDITGLSISNASIEIVSSSYNTTTNLSGSYNLGSVDWTQRDEVYF